MPGLVNLVCGDLFDGPADLVVLPCSTAGTFTPKVAARLAQFSIPPPQAMPLGDIRLIALDDASQVAQFAALAASVANFESSPQTVRQIGAALGRETRAKEGIRIVNAPLLGAGAGGLEPELAVENLRNGFLAEAAEGAILHIYVLDEAVYRRLLPLVDPGTASHVPDLSVPRSEHRVRQTEARAPLRVLISYTSNSPEQRAWVEDLYAFLRRNGVDARLDTYSLRVGGDVVQWMCNELFLADRVLLICDERYAQRADGRLGGVGWETMLVQGDLFAAMSREDDGGGEKYIPIVRTPGLDEGRPRFLLTKRVIHWPPEAASDDPQRELLEELYEVRNEPPPLGHPPDWVNPGRV
jgi:hypothetical protein